MPGASEFSANNITKLPSIQPTEFKIRKYAYPPALEPGVTAKTKTKIKK